MNNYDVNEAEMPTCALISLIYKQGQTFWVCKLGCIKKHHSVQNKHRFCVDSKIGEYSIHIERFARSLYPTELLVLSSWGKAKLP